VPNAHDPCFYTGFVRDSHDSSSLASTVLLSLGLYVDDFIHFSEDPPTEALFERLLREWVNVDFMGLVEWFLGIHFSWRFTSSEVDVHLNQPDLLQTSSSNSVGIRGMLRQQPHLIALGFLLTPSHLQLMPMILQLNFVRQRLIKVSSAA